MKKMTKIEIRLPYDKKNRYKARAIASNAGSLSAWAIYHLDDARAVNLSAIRKGPKKKS